MQPRFPYSIQPLGDSALLIDFGNRIDEDLNKWIIDLFTFLNGYSINGITDIVPAYSSLAVYYDFALVRNEITGNLTVFETLKQSLIPLLAEKFEAAPLAPRTIRIPVCYDLKYGTDLTWISGQTNLTIEDIITIHTTSFYRVYMLGFLPGFPYMGEVNERLVVPRKKSVSQVCKGSVALAGKQTGIYPLDSPGGWQVIGRTPMEMFNKEKEHPVLLGPGDQVTFYSITSDEFDHYQTRNSG